MESDEAALDADFSPRRKYRGLSPLDTEFEQHSIRNSRKSIRTRPSQLLQKNDVVPLSPVKASAPAPQLHSRKSKMSLFGLFSKPNVEKARGYAEPGLAPPPSLAPKGADGSRPTSVVDSQPGGRSHDGTFRSASAMSMRTIGARQPAKSKAKMPGPEAVMKERNKGPWSPPPLFQAYPQSLKQGILEVSTVSAETVLQKSKSRKAGGHALPSMDMMMSRESVDDRGSVDTRRTARTTMRHVANGSIVRVDLPRKIFVLVTSGYLLQYAEKGPSDRLPERVLQLGKDSAAFACDLIPGKHYVLQISQAVDHQGVVLANTGSIFSKLGLRSTATRRQTSSFLLVMPNAEEMDHWMIAIREEIEALGGKKVRPDTAVRPKTRDGMDELAELKSLPSLSHRYQVKREASKVSLVSKPSTETVGPLPPPPPAKDDDERSDTATIDGIEQEAEQLAEESRASQSEMQSETHQDPDSQSISSSVAVSIDHQRLNSLRSSNRMSHSTYATTIATSTPPSLSGSPPSEQPLQGSLETNKDNMQPRSPYRTLSSYASGWRRSAMPMPTTRELPLPALDVSAQIQKHSALEANTDSPVIGRNSPLPAPSISPRKLAVASSEPNLRGAADVRAKHDSKMPTPPLPSESERPLSIVGDLVTPSSWAADRSPNRRISIIQAAAAQANAQRAGVRLAPRNGAEPFKSSRRQSAQPFTLPLKVNPSTPANRPPSRHENRGSFNKVEESTGEPQVHTLTAKIDASRLAATSPGSSGPPTPEIPLKSPSRTPSGKLSLFPSSIAPVPVTTGDGSEPLKRSPSAAAQSTFAQAQANGNTLKRPTSVQVRSDHAPFLQGVRTSTVGPMVGTGRSFTAPIRSLKPSRSSTHVVTKPQSPTDPFTIRTGIAENPALPEEAADQPTPLPERALSPMLSRPPSRSSGRRIKTRSSLPELDLGIPVVGLGPPAPPPQAPLPAPPPASRPTTPLPSATGLGIKVS